MGGNTSKTVTENIVKSALNNVLDISVSRSAISNNEQSLEVKNNTGTTVDGINMSQQVSIRLRSHNIADATTYFSASIESQIKEKISQATELGSITSASANTIEKSAQEFNANCSKIFRDNITILLNSKQSIAIENNQNAAIKAVHMSQTVEGAIDAVSKIVTNDKSIQSAKSVLDRHLVQKAEGFAGMVRAYGDAISNIMGGLQGPLVLIALVIGLGLFFYFMVIRK